MTQAISFLVVSKEAWAQPRRARKQLLFEALLRESLVDEILYLDPPRHIWQSPSKRQPMPERMRIWQASLIVPGERFPWVRALNRWLVARMLAKRIRRGKRWCTVLYHPWDADLIPHLKQYGPVLFDWTEDWSVFHANQQMRLAQERCVRSATAVITVTEVLAARASVLRGSRSDILVLPNATALPVLDDAHPLPMPDDIAMIPEPRIGYVGHMGPWFDSELLMHLAVQRPDWQWVLVGHADQNISSGIGALPNVHLMGEKPLSQLQAYLGHCQVLAAPYRKNLCGDASKLYDYLTIGTPIVSSDIETARRLAKWVRVADTTAQWVQAISEGLSKGNQMTHDARRKAVQTCSWAARAKTFIDWLACHGDVG
jgi:glycosyltransferase involved in cell wall biosynthesis